MLSHGHRSLKGNNMSDNATLVERLNERKAYFRDGGPDHWPMAELLRNAAARIAELEAERDRLKISLGEALAYRSEDHGPGKKS